MKMGRLSAKRLEKSSRSSMRATVYLAPSSMICHGPILSSHSEL